MEIPTSATVTVVSRSEVLSVLTPDRDKVSDGRWRLSPNALVHVVVFPIVLINELMLAMLLII